MGEHGEGWVDLLTKRGIWKTIGEAFWDTDTHADTFRCFVLGFTERRSGLHLIRW